MWFNSCRAFLRRCMEFPGYDVNGFLDDLITDATGFAVQGLLDQVLCGLAFFVIDFIKQVNKDVGVEEVFNAHSFRPE